jgi:hypothetical protein
MSLLRKNSSSFLKESLTSFVSQYKPNTSNSVLSIIGEEDETDFVPLRVMSKKKKIFISHSSTTHFRSSKR